MRYVNVSVHTALYELHVVLGQSPRLVREDVLHLEKAELITASLFFCI